MILDDILAETRRTVARAQETRPRAVVEAAAAEAPAPRGFAAALRGPDIRCIAEFKRRSPSAGWIRQDGDPAVVARSYQAAGAAALSVLTDEPFFGGALADLQRARAAVPLPVLRKDFTVDAYQIAEARAAGADAVLLIVAALTDAELTTLLGEARRWELDALVEAHDADEVERALAVGARLVGINHRDLRTFKMDMTLAERLRDRIPRDCVLVAESGIRTAEDVRRMRSAGMDAILVGESLMRAPDPGAALRTLLGSP
jgi:indole-3-glycerol phosphate synthase